MKRDILYSLFVLLTFGIILIQSVWFLLLTIVSIVTIVTVITPRTLGIVVFLSLGGRKKRSDQVSPDEQCRKFHFSVSTSEGKSSNQEKQLTFFDVVSEGVVATEREWGLIQGWKGAVATT